MEPEEILSGQSHLKKENLAEIIGPEPENYLKLVELAFSRQLPVCWRAAWILDYLSELHPWLPEDYISRFWSEISEKHPDGVTRSVLRLLTRYDIPGIYQGIAADLCLDWITKEAVPVAIKAFSMDILLKIAKIYPELKDEFIAVLEEESPRNSSGFGARAAHVLDALRKL